MPLSHVVQCIASLLLATADREPTRAHTIRPVCANLASADMRLLCLDEARNHARELGDTISNLFFTPETSSHLGTSPIFALLPIRGGEC